MGELFISQYAKKPRTVGAILPSSRYLATKMVGEINFETANVIVEYGPGTGVFTKELLKRRKQGTVLLLIEINEDFYQYLLEEYSEEKNVHIIHGSAEHIKQYLEGYGIKCVDYIVSGLPFSSLPKNLSISILKEAASILRKEGMFITFQYTKMKKMFIEQFFSSMKIQREFLNLPPAYIFHCQK
ncbi:class I SAM-dependent methyltransferase [Priestia flexa]|uniref:class I SAM-dependent methyltransferase n=1 Tax=Priestia flexa TaxID=86664 RepID=UPI001B33A09B|nr:rRNA adenine N-6-methyltransferase family protein [Priestia flexa]